MLRYSSCFKNKQLTRPYGLGVIKPGRRGFCRRTVKISRISTEFYNFKFYHVLNTMCVSRVLRLYFFSFFTVFFKFFSKISFFNLFKLDLNLFFINSFYALYRKCRDSGISQFCRKPINVESKLKR